MRENAPPSAQVRAPPEPPSEARTTGPDGVVFVSPAAEDSSTAPLRSWSARDAGLAVLIGPLIVVAGVVLFAIGGMNKVPASEVGGMLVFLGVAVCAAPRWTRRSKKAMNGRKRGDAFERDHAWPAEGEGRGAIGRSMGRSQAFLNVGLMLAAAAIAVAQAWPIEVTIGLGSVLVVGAALWALRIATAPRVRVGYLARPYVLGEPVSVRVGVSERGSAVQRMTVSLRCVKERIAQVKPRRGRTRPALVRHVVWSAEARLNEALQVPAPGADVDLTFHPPPGLPETALSALPALYWELQVVAGDGPTSLEYRFLLPVYGAELEPAV